jgi:excisionase family DNA binding protein
MQEPITLSVPEAGRRYFGLSRQSSYDAAKNGNLPVIRIGRRLRVPVRALEKLLDSVTERISGGK